MSGEICVICRDDLSGADTYTLPECSHTCHVECFITWFRSPRDWELCPKGFGTCPLCREGPKTTMNYNTIEGRVSLLRKLVRKKNTHPIIKKHVNILKDFENESKESKKSIKRYEKENKIHFITYRKLRQKMHKCDAKIWKKKREICAFDPLSMI